MFQALALLCLLLLVDVFPALALDVTITGTEVSLGWMEPSTNVTGTPLTDLKETRGYFQQSGGAPQLGVTVPASSATGGQTVTGTITVPILQNQEADVSFWVTASDGSGNESPGSAVLIRRLDRLAPSAPQ